MATIDPKLWGKSGWIFLHSVTLGYPNDPTDDDKNNYRIFFNTIKDVLPCGKCRQNYSNSIGKYGLTDDVLISRDALVNWLIRIRSDDMYTTNKNINVKTIMNEIGITKVNPLENINYSHVLNKNGGCNC